MIKHYTITVLVYLITETKISRLFKPISLLNTLLYIYNHTNDKIDHLLSQNILVETTIPSAGNLLTQLVDMNNDYEYLDINLIPSTIVRLDKWLLFDGAQLNLSDVLKKITNNLTVLYKVSYTNNASYTNRRLSPVIEELIEIILISIDINNRD